ncbi:MAG TPA: class I SAM-dependent RNA methyltransferase [Rhodobacteraceae bacterium]|nr:class I SAM-dependent RNA methyltransferase [Paracoccaceae bacterium]
MQVTIERLGHQGDGIGHSPDFSGPVFVPRVLPGEVVEGDLVGDRIAKPRIVTPSPDRVRPPCPHYKSCGGCALQHASDTFVAGWKTQVVRTALAARGIEAQPDAIVTSPARARRRAVFSARRTKGGVLIGFHAPKSDIITSIPACHLLHPDLLAAMPALEALVLEGASRKSMLRLNVALSDGGADVAVTGGKPPDPRLETSLATLAGQHGLARLSWEGETIALVEPPAQIFGRARVTPPPGAFLQATKEGEAALLDGVRASVAGAKKVVDLFAGSGTFTLPLAETAEVHAVEDAAGMLAALDQGWRRAQGLKLVTTEPRDLFRRPLLPDELKPFDAVVIDPPRAGAEAQFAELASAEVSRIAAVSCNPVTFARDAALLIAGGFRLDRLTVVDQFRWSTHVELVAGFSR